MACPVCNDVGSLWFKSKDLTGSVPASTEFSVFRCGQCITSFLEPMPTTDVLKQAYGGAYYSFQTSSSGQPDIPLNMGQRRWWNYFTPFFRRNYVELLREEILWTVDKGPLPSNEVKRILDVGCGSGQYTTALANLFPHAMVVGQDEYIAYGNPEHHSRTLYFSTLDECKKQGPFDIIVVRNVVEHFTDPKSVFSNLTSLAHDKTRLFIQTPNLKSWDARWFKSIWFGFEIPRHTVVFSDQSLPLFAKKTGWKVLKQRSHFVPTAWLYYLSMDNWTFVRLGRRLPKRTWTCLAPILSVIALVAVLFKGGGDLEAVLVPDRST